jgi:uncharacterized membrane protein YsdA (DUF1294 family)
MSATAVGLIFAVLGLNVFTFLVFAYDKACAVRGTWRVPERQLFLLMLVGGSLGGWLAMVRLHHKTRKTSFRSIASLIVLLQLVALAELVHQGIGANALP